MASNQATSAAKDSTHESVNVTGLIAALIALIGVMLLPTPQGLPAAGQIMLALLLFSVILWATEAVDYAISAVLITALMAFMLGLAPNAAKPAVALGTGPALTLALSGFANTALALVAAACFLSAAMTITGLDKRIALFILSKVGARTNRVLIGAILVGIVLSFLVPSTTARVACLVPIIMGIILAFGVDKRSRFAGMLMIATAQAASIWNVGVKTAAAQNMVAIGFIEKTFKTTITWGDWLVAAAPWSILMSIALYFVMIKMMPPETDEIAGGKETIRQALHDLGPMTFAEKKLLTIMLVLLGFWATEKVLHPFDTSSTTIAAIALMFTPGIGVMGWKQAQSRIPWGTIVLFGTGISLGNLGFASATALASAMIPIMISVLQQIAGAPDATPLNLVGMTMLFQFVVSFGFILPVNAPQNMVACGTDTFAVKDFVKTGLVLTVIAYVLVLLLGATYWPWMGYMAR